MRWEKVRQQQLQVGQDTSSSGPGKRWGHTCNAIKGGSFLYVFGGYGKDSSQTNEVHVFDSVKQIWTQLIISGTPPPPRDSHTCTTVGDSLFVFGGTDGTKSLKDLYILDTSSHTWICPSLRGEEPEAREGHSATLVGKRLFVFGGCAKSSDSNDEIYYNDLYILNTENFVWKRAVTYGNPPAARDSHTCSLWKNKIVVIGGEDGHDYYLSDVHILDTDTFIWKEMNTSGQFLTPRAGHVTVSLGRNLFVFGGFTDAQNLHNDLYVLDVDTCVWSKVLTVGEGPSARFSSAGACLDPFKAGFLVFFGGCNKNLDSLDDMFYLHTGLGNDSRFDQNIGSMSLKKQMKLKCQEQSHTGRGSFDLNAGQVNQEKRAFQARITESFPIGYSIETIIDGKPLRGIVFSTKQGSVLATDQSLSSRVANKRPATSNSDQDNRSKIPRTDHADATESKDTPANGGDASIGPISNTEAVAPHETETPRLDTEAVTTAAPSSVPETEEASLESRNAVSIDVGGDKTRAGES